MPDMRLARGRRCFEYHCYEGEDSNDALLWHHTHQVVEVLSKPQDDADNRMYGIKFRDGFISVAFDDELVKSPTEFYRPGYEGLK